MGATTTLHVIEDGLWPIRATAAAAAINNLNYFEKIIGVDSEDTNGDTAWWM